MSSLEEKKSELERVLGVFQNYIEGSELLDVVYSKKFGYVLLGLPAADSIDDSDVTRRSLFCTIQESRLMNTIPRQMTR